MTRKKVSFIKLYAAMLTLALVLCVLSSATFAWLRSDNQTRLDVPASIRLSYFERGRGTQEDPFVIHTPEHLYNLAWLQYLGLLDATGHGNDYFEICTGEDGKCIEKNKEISQIDMTGYVLPPIGTDANPFKGHFHGNGKAITNLTVSDTDFSGSKYAAPSTTRKATSSVGLFGSVSNGATVQNVTLSNITVNSSAGKTSAP